ncbi:hypothetical protein GCM10027445_54470 [Amycolatopsis endophytica]
MSKLIGAAVSLSWGPATSTQILEQAFDSRSLGCPPIVPCYLLAGTPGWSWEGPASTLPPSPARVKKRCRSMGVLDSGVTDSYSIGCISGFAASWANAVFAQLSLIDPRRPKV